LIPVEQVSSLHYQVIVEGPYSCDLIFADLNTFPRLGHEVFSTHFDITPGAAYNVAFGLHRLGVRVGWAADFGNDFFSQFVLNRAQDAGLDTSLFRQHPIPIRTVTSAFSFQADRAFVTYMDRIEPTSLIPLIETYRPPFLMFMHLKHDAAFHETARIAHQRGVAILMDCQETSLTLADPRVGVAVQAIDIFAANASEACQLTGAASVTEALARLSQLTPTVVIKMGTDGALAQRGDESVRVPALKVEVVDTTGAGDCFNCGFLYGLLRGYSLRECVRCGNICGGLAVTAPGSQALPDAAELERRLKDYPE